MRDIKEFLKLIGVMLWYFFLSLAAMVGIIIIEALYNGYSVKNLFTKALPIILNM